jgi:hypothetical protein
MLPRSSKDIDSAGVSVSVSLSSADDAGPECMRDPSPGSLLKSFVAVEKSPVEAKVPPADNIRLAKRNNKTPTR